MVGIGYDVHRYEKGNRIRLGGIDIPSEYSCIAHSDGDVVLHSLIDALLGATGLGDIGDHFPDTDLDYKNISSVKLLNKVLLMIQDCKIINIDMTIVAEKPKLFKYKRQIADNIAKLCSCDVHRVNVKATTNEKMGSLGREEGIGVLCVVQIEK